MCGICCTLPIQTQNAPYNPKLAESLAEILKNRGPNVQHQISLSNGVTFYGFVLWQQGDRPAKQPLESDKFILLFNGDIFNATKDNTVSDTTWLISKLDECNDEKDILNLLRLLEGPYSLIAYDKKAQCVYFVRDPLGRNSLLLERDLHSIRILSSSYMSKDTKTIEIPPVGVFKFNTSLTSNHILYPWTELDDDQKSSLTLVSSFICADITIGEAIDVPWSISKRRKLVYDFSEILAQRNSNENVFESLLPSDEIAKTIHQLKSLIHKSVEDRVRNSPRYCVNCIEERINVTEADGECLHAKLGILFSGGIDCTILAAIAHEYVPETEPIDLINVAFEPVNKSGSSCESYNVPDRLSALDSFNELKSLFPHRQWNLVEVDVDRNQMESAMRDHICHLIYPLETVLDESLGCAFWFASRGIGKIQGDPYSTPCRVILVGSGADELFGGYIRHRNAFNRCKGDLAEKIKALDDELDLDWKRIPTRNLGRDDRIIADNGRTSRAPFIEENLVQFVRQLHPLEICCFELDQGIGDKLLLRLVGYSLGLRGASQFKKRAIQFGSRIADKKQNAKEISVYLSHPTERDIE